MKLKNLNLQRHWRRCMNYAWAIQQNWQSDTYFVALMSLLILQYLCFRMWWFPKQTLWFHGRQSDNWESESGYRDWGSIQQTENQGDETSLGVQLTDQQEPKTSKTAVVVHNARCAGGKIRLKFQRSVNSKHFTKCFAWVRRKRGWLKYRGGLVQLQKIAKHMRKKQKGKHHVGEPESEKTW